MATPLTTEQQIRIEVEKNRRRAQATVARQQGNAQAARAVGGQSVGSGLTEPGVRVPGGTTAGSVTREVPIDAVSQAERDSLARQSRAAPQQPAPRMGGIESGLNDRPAPRVPGTASPEQVQFNAQRAAQQQAMDAAGQQPAQPRPAAQRAAPATEAPRAASRLGRAGKALVKGSSVLGGVGGVIQGYEAATGQTTSTPDLTDRFGDWSDYTGAGLIGRGLEEVGELVGSDTISNIGSMSRDLGRRGLPVVVEPAADLASMVGGAAGSATNTAANRFSEPAAPAAADPLEPVFSDPAPRPQAPGGGGNGLQRDSGEFMGKDGVMRTIGKQEMQDIAGRLQVVGDPQNGGRAFGPPPAGGGNVASFGGGGGGAQAPSNPIPSLIRELRDPTSAAGRMYAELNRDTTPTGKRRAQQFLSEYLGFGVEQQRIGAGFASNENQIGAQRDIAQSAQAASAAGGQRRAQPTVRVGNDGSVIQVQDGIATQLPVLDSSGRPVQKQGRQLSIGDLTGEIGSGTYDDETMQALELERKRALERLLKQ
jgi:hypothetical protein